MSNDDYGYLDYAYDQTPLMFDTSGGQPEMNPYLAEMIANMFQGPLDKYGNPEPIDLSVQNQMQTGLQSRYRTLFDLGNAALTGGFSPAAFAPDVTEKQLDFPKTGSLQVQAQMGGYQGQLAKLILGDPARGIRGMSPAQAAAAIRAAIENQGDNISDAERAELMAGLPMTYDQNKLEDVVDWNAVQKEAASLATPYYEEQGIMERALMPNSGVIQRDGKFFQTTETPSAASQWFQKQGLDLPSTQYDEDYLRRTSGFGDIESALQANFADLLGERGTYAGNEALRRRNADLERKFTAQDAAAMDRFSGGVQGAFGDMRRAAGGTMLANPAWGGGRYVGDPTVMPQLGQRTDTQNARDAALNLSLRPVENMDQLGYPTDVNQRSIRQALADYMSQSSREPMTTVAGHGGSDMRLGPRTELGLPGLPTLSTYSDPTQYDKLSMAQSILPQSVRRLLGTAGNIPAAQRTALENQGKLRPQGPKTSKQQDANRRTDAYNRTHAAQLAYAQQLLAADLARKAGHTPFQDQIAARAQSMYGLGSMGR